MIPTTAYNDTHLFSTSTATAAAAANNTPSPTSPSSFFAKNLSSHYLDAIQTAGFGAALKIPSQKQTKPTFTLLVLLTSFYQTTFGSKKGAFRNNIFTSMASMTPGYALSSDTSTIFPLETLPFFRSHAVQEKNHGNQGLG
jgi:hypothetical protein